jgi:hypothetical protein
MSLTVKNCLNRWCLRTTAGGRIPEFINRLGQMDESPSDWGKHVKGRPPLIQACIAPHCDHWEAIDEEHGHCLIRRMLRPMPAAPAVTTMCIG